MNERRTLPAPYAVVANPAAGPGRKRAALHAFLADLEVLLPGAAVRWTRGPGDARRLAARAAADGAGTVFVAGGDGTVNEALQGLVNTDACLAPLPAGTANVLCRELVLPLSPPAAMTALLTRVPRAVSVGRVEGTAGTARHFLLMAGAGLDAAVVGAVDRGTLKKPLGVGAYFLHGALTAVTYRYPPITVTVNGGETLTGTSVVLANARNYGGPFVLAPDAGLERPDLGMVLFQGQGPLPYLLHGLGVMTGRHTAMPGVEVRAGARFEVHSPGTPAVHVDGELCGRLPLTVSVLPRALRLPLPTPA